MAEKTFILEIVTPEKSVFSGEVESLGAPGTEGYFQVLHNHTPFVCTLQTGEIIVDTDGGKAFFATSGGFAEVSNNKVTVLAETAEKTDDIDVFRAEEAKKRAEDRLQSSDKDIDIERARLALFRALNRIRAAGRH